MIFLHQMIKLLLILPTRVQQHFGCPLYIEVQYLQILLVRCHGPPAPCFGRFLQDWPLMLGLSFIQHPLMLQLCYFFTPMLWFQGLPFFVFTSRASVAFLLYPREGFTWLPWHLSLAPKSAPPQILLLLCHSGDIVGLVWCLTLTLKSASACSPGLLALARLCLLHSCRGIWTLLFCNDKGLSRLVSWLMVVVAWIQHSRLSSRWVLLYSNTLELDVFCVTWRRSYWTVH